MFQSFTFIYSVLCGLFILFLALDHSSTAPPLPATSLQNRDFAVAEYDAVVKETNSLLEMKNTIVRLLIKINGSSLDANDLNLPYFAERAFRKSQLGLNIITTLFESLMRVVNSLENFENEIISNESRHEIMALKVEIIGEVERICHVWSYFQFTALKLKDFARKYSPVINKQIEEVNDNIKSLYLLKSFSALQCIITGNTNTLPLYWKDQCSKHQSSNVLTSTNSV
jgi:hypothetical protein